MTEIKNITESLYNNRLGTETLNYSILASGSSGNCIYVESATHGVLIDAGLSGKRIEGLMAQIDRTLHDVDAIFVTHEHKDHVHGVGVLSRKYKLPIYANKNTWSQMANMIGKISVLKNPLKDTVTAQQMNISNATNTFEVVIISDGEIAECSMQLCGITEEWLNQTLRKNNVSIKDIFIMTATSEHEYSIIKKEG